MSGEADWYERRDELEPDQVFRTHEGSIVKLDRRVEGDGTQWHCAVKYPAGWWSGDRIIEPGDLKERLE